ncbi:MAG: deoxynucleoside kinase [Gammaproteobacteria bacterium]|nr:deoxynucleoside kinase [Gammaproteobacteria bacterium]
MTLATSHHRYIVIEGPIGVGKTSLARRLADSFGSELILEDAAGNPFLDRFYDDPKSAALPVQLFFLFQRAQQMQSLMQDDMFTPVRVADFLMDKDRLFAELTLDQHELNLYQQVADNLSVEAPKPDLVVYLQAPADVLRERISGRNIKAEQMIDNDYLTRLVDVYSRFFHDYNEAPLLIVNAADIDPVNNDDDYQLLLKRILSMKNGRHYFNPLPIAM